MRPGLVAVGTVLVVLAVGAVAVVTLVPSGTHVTQNTVHIPPTGTGANETQTALLPGTTATEATFSVSWQSSVPTQVWLYSVPGCTRASLACATGSAVEHWSAATAGNWTSDSDLVFPYLVVWNTSSPTPGVWQLSAAETVTTSLALPLWETVVIIAAGAALALVGGVAVFLGLFLRGGVYQGPAPVVSRSAEDAEPVARGPPARPRR